MEKNKEQNDLSDNLSKHNQSQDDCEDDDCDCCHDDCEDDDCVCHDDCDDDDCDCCHDDCEDGDCDCCHDEVDCICKKTENNSDHCDCKSNNKQINMFNYDEADYDGDDYCELDPGKICDNCGKCLNEYQTDKEGFVSIGIDKVDEHPSLEDLYRMYGLDDDNKQ